MRNTPTNGTNDSHVALLRVNKARKLADFLESSGITAEMIEDIDLNLRGVISHRVLNRPSSDTTWQLVLGLMNDRTAARATSSTGACVACGQALPNHTQPTPREIATTFFERNADAQSVGILGETFERHELIPTPLHVVREDEECPICEGEGSGALGPNDVTCDHCGGTGVRS